MYSPNSNWDMFLNSSIPVVVADETRAHLCLEMEQNVLESTSASQTHTVLTSSQYRPPGPGLVQSDPGVLWFRTPVLTEAGQSHPVTRFDITMDGAVRSGRPLWHAAEGRCEGLLWHFIFSLLNLLYALVWLTCSLSGNQSHFSDHSTKSFGLDWSALLRGSVIESVSDWCNTSLIRV